ncbi:MAG TPA: triose-phosphate isomerase [Thermoanaerobaculia bacterium]
MNLIVANWKMNMLRAGARAYAEELGRRIGERELSVELSIAPPLTALDAVRDPRGRWSLAGQNVSSETEGAFTGEVSARQLADAGCRYVIVGHSERRRIFGEDGKVLAAKLAQVRSAGLTPIYCVGETQEERARNLSIATLTRQIETLAGDPPDRPLVLAYEPVWAIGTGNVATPGDCAAACRHLRSLLSNRRDLRLLYGGSVTPENAGAMQQSAGIDGFLIGGASLTVSSFAAIAGLA